MVVTETLPRGRNNFSLVLYIHKKDLTRAEMEIKSRHHFINFTLSNTFIREQDHELQDKEKCLPEMFIRRACVNISQ